MCPQKNSGLTPGAVVTHQTWMLFLASSMRETVWKKDRSSQVQIRINLPQLFTWSSLQIKMTNSIDLKGLSAIGDLLPGLSSFVVNHFCYHTSKSLPSLCLLKYFNRQASKRNNLAKERDANVSLGVVEVHVTYTKCPSLAITVIIIIIFLFIYLFF